MQTLVWDKSFSVGIREFDQHHKILFEMVNSLIIAKEENSGPEVIKSTLEQLHMYTIFHFTAEESMMRHFEYKGLDDQILEHGKLLQQVEQFRSDLEASKDVSVDEILDFVAGWLLDHTLGMDQLYGSFLSRYSD